MTERPYSAAHLAALRRFAAAITILTILGHAVLGFESSYAQPLVALATAYGMQLLVEAIDARQRRRPPRFAGGLLSLVDFLLSAHITALAITMLLYFSDRLWPVVFTTAVAIASKSVFRVPFENGTRHVFNPSNFGISVALFLFPRTIGAAPPWQFTEELPGFLDWGLLGFIFVLGTLINVRYTQRMPLIVAWAAGFVLQAVIRSLWFQTSLLASLAPMTGIAFALFSFYMAPDPATTPAGRWPQVAFGAAIAAAYGVLMALHVAFALFFALTVVCAARGLGRLVIALARVGRARQALAREPVSAA